MDTPAVIVIIVANIMTWGGLFVGVRSIVRRAKKSADHRGRPQFTGPVTKHGHEVEVRRLWVTSGTHERSQQHEFVDYWMKLPAPLDSLSIVEGEAFEQRTNRLQPSVDLQRVSAPETEDDVFNGVFDYVSPPSASTVTALQDPTLRGLLMDIHRVYGNLWVQDGVVRVYQEGMPDEDEIDVNAEFLTGIATQIVTAVS